MWVCECLWFVCVCVFVLWALCGVCVLGFVLCVVFLWCMCSVFEVCLICVCVV